MNQIVTERRDRQRRAEQRTPFGALAAIITGCLVTLIGVFSDIEPFVVLIRTLVSSIAMGTLVSVGVSIIRAADLKRE